MEARSMSAWLSPNVEVQSRSGVLPVAFLLWVLCWTGCATPWEGDEDGEDDAL